MKMRKITLFITLLLLQAGVLFGQSVAGRFHGNWNGEISVGAQKIKMEFEILEKDGAPVGRMSAQGVKGIPVAVEINGDSLQLQVKQLGLKIDGVLQGTEIRGTFFQNGFTTAMVLKQGKVELKRPQTPKVPFPYKSEEVTFENRAEGAVLSGTLTFPVGYENMKQRKVPVVVMVTGSGTQNRDEEIFGHKPFAVIADWLARNGIASLRYDDRGAGKSTGEVATATTRNNANDARCGVEYIRSLKKFGKVGVLGHSEGGTIALMLAGEQVPDFIVSMAGVATSGLDCIVWQNLAQLELCYAPPYNSAKDPVNYAGFVASNVRMGLVKQEFCNRLDSLLADPSVTVLDVRTDLEVGGYQLPGAKCIPLDSLRGRLDEIDPRKPVYVVCRSGLRSYIACRILSQNGFDCYNMAGGQRQYELLKNMQN